MGSDLLELEDRVVVVSGAGGGGIGTATAELVAQSGATVVGVDISPASLERFVAPLAARGLSVVPCLADVRTPEGIALVMDRVRAAPGKLHGLVTVVGGAHAADWKSSLDVSRADWAAAQAWNLESAFFMMQAVARELRNAGSPGSLVAISSISGIGSAPNHVGYGAAKAAILSIVRSMALELAAAGIRVNAVAPGATATPGSLVGSEEHLLRDAVPMGRVGGPDEIAAAVLFLLSNLSRYMIGQCLIVDGGTSLRWTHFDKENLPKLVNDEAFKQRLRGN